ncbi:MAG: MFS transporter [Eubacteriaceae bacterium]|nr:MFS transporter [Eubacteriaceae bacterium]
MIDCAEYGYWKSGIDNRIVAQSLANVPVKISIFASSTIALYGLSFIGYKPGMAVDRLFVRNYMILYGGMPAACDLLCFIIDALFYKIDDKEAALYARANREREAASAN